MIRPQRITWERAKDCTSRQTRHLILGNGFAIEARPRFKYPALADVAVSLDPTLGPIFERAGTSNFEEALGRLADQQSAETQAIRQGLIKAVAHIHPSTARAVDDQEAGFCQAFLAEFVAPARRPFRGKIFTTNYDLLLYWMSVRFARVLSAEDGFLYREFRPTRLHLASVFFLHGGLHLFDNRGEVERIQYNDQRLIEQLRSRLNHGQFPIFISERDSADKLRRIKALPYTKPVWKAFERTMREPSAALFTWGHSLSPEDSHITDAIGNGQIAHLYIGIHGGIANASRIQKLIPLWEDQRGRNSLHPITRVMVFDSREVSVWKPGELAEGYSETGSS